MEHQKHPLFSLEISGNAKCWGPSVFLFVCRKSLCRPTWYFRVIDQITTPETQEHCDNDGKTSPQRRVAGRQGRVRLLRFTKRRRHRAAHAHTHAHTLAHTHTRARARARAHTHTHTHTQHPKNAPRTATVEPTWPETSRESRGRFTSIDDRPPPSNADATLCRVSRASACTVRSCRDLCARAVRSHGFCRMPLR